MVRKQDQGIGIVEICFTATEQSMTALKSPPVSGKQLPKFAVVSVVVFYKECPHEHHL